MTLALRSRPRILVLAVVLALVAGAFAALAASRADAQEPGSVGAAALKNCPGIAVTIGTTVTCNFRVENIGASPATVIALSETSPFIETGDPANGTPVNITCTLPDGTSIELGDTLDPDVACSGTFQVTIADNPALCGTAVRDQVEIALSYPETGPPPLTAGAFATHTSRVVCPPEITVTKRATELSKVGDTVTYTIEVCNTGPAAVTRRSVIDTLFGGIGARFPLTLAPGDCSGDVVLTRTVAPGDPDPLRNTVTARYSSQPFPNLPAIIARDTATATTNLFQPAVDVTKNCSPDPIEVGEAELCTIVVTNSSSIDTPLLEGAVITDTLTGNLLDPANTAVVDRTCTATLAVGASCTINTTRTVLDTDPDVLVNTVTVHYNPDGFMNDISDSATFTVNVERPGGEGCTPGFWKQDQHFDSWVGFEPTQSFADVFGVDDVTLRGDGQDTIENPTLLQALEANGGDVNALARHAVAALLNASNPDVASDFTTAEVIALVQAAFASGDFETAHQLLADANEQSCPLS
jgi:uncharacterized repeat protein (TIGR01451 family)